MLPVIATITPTPRCFRCRQAPWRFCDTLPNSDYVIHEASPNARGMGKTPARTGIRQFPGDNATPVGVRASARMDLDDNVATDMRAEAHTPIKPHDGDAQV